VQEVWRVDVRPSGSKRPSERFCRASTREAAAALWNVEPETVSAEPPSREEQQAIGPGPPQRSGAGLGAFDA